MKMKKFTKAGAKFAAAAAVSVMALGYTTSVWAEENKVVEIGKEFADIKGTQTVSLPSIYFSSKPADNVKGIGLDIHNVEKLNIINSDDGGLFIGSHANAYKKGESVGIAVKDAQADFDIKDDLFVWVSGAIKKKEGETGAADVSMRAVGFYGENGSSQIEANSVSYTVHNEDRRETPTGTLDEVTLGMVANKYNINILAEEDIEISSSIKEVKLPGKMTAQGMILSNGSKASLQAKEGNISISATVGDSIVLSSATSSVSFGPVSGIYAASSELDMQAGGTIQIGAAIIGFTGNNKLAAINASNSKINIKAKKGIEIVAANKDEAGAMQNENVYAILAEKSAIALDGGKSGISIFGNVNVLNNSILKLSGKTSIGKKFTRTVIPGSNLTVENSTLVVDGIVKTVGETKLDNAKLYFYDAQTQDNGFHALRTTEMQLKGTNELYLRADSSQDSDVGNLALNSDVVFVESVTGSGNFNVHVLDEGMKTGYGMGADGEKELKNKITVFYNPNSNVDLSQFVNSVTTTYDNGIWNYAYSMYAEQEGKSLVIKKNVEVKAQPSGSQRSVHSANKAAGALAVDVLGGDSALREHLREVREHKDNENVWAKYHGGKLKADGVQLKYNGVEVGYDAYVGNDWTFGVSGQQVRGNTQLDSGSGKAKTNVGTVYGAWHGGSSYLNLEAKAGRVSSESKTFGGTVLQKIAGEFSAPAYSVSAEYGSTHELPPAWYLEPAVRLSYVHMGAADYSVRTQETLARVANDSFDSFILRGGAKLGRRLGAKGSFYVKAAAVYDFGGDLATTVSADGRTAPPYEDSLGGWGVEYGAGLEYKLGKAANISLDFERRSGGELKRDWGVNVGVNYSF